MAYIIDLKTHIDVRGELTPVDGVLPFDIKRFYYVNNVSDDANRGGHAHYRTIEALFCVNGSFNVTINDGKKRTEYLLDTPSKCLIIEPLEWHLIHNFGPGTVLMGVTSTNYDHTDYILKEPEIANDTL